MTRELGAEDKLGMQTDLINMMVHDLKGPLMEVIANVDLLQNSPNLSADDKDFAATAMEGCQILLETVTDMLDLGKLEAGMLKLDKKSVDLSRIVQKELKRIQTSADERRVKVTYAGDPSLTVAADEKIIRRVVANLISNGLKFSPPGASLMTFLTREGDGVKFVIKDEGPGIPAAYRDTIFDKYTQIELRTHRQPGGTGLGLSFCKLAIEAHGGKIGTNEVPKGTEFQFLIPES